MIHDLLREEPSQDAATADVCIVGAGAAGIVLAAELTAAGKRVLLLEGGGRDVEEAAQEPYRSEVAGHAHSGIHSGRFRAHGGTTTRWGGQILELDSIDFERRDWVPGSGWPFPKQELAPFYARALELEGVAGALQQDAEVWRAIGLAEPEFDGLTPYLSRWCPEPNFARVHARLLEGESVSVWLHANVIELLLEGDIVRGVRCRTQTGREAVFRASEYVFCMGSIECVRFFMQPRAGALPWNRSGLLGRHFQDHIDANIAEIRPRNRKVFGSMFDNIFYRGFKYHPKLRLASAIQAQQKTLNCGGTMTFASDVEDAAVAIKSTAKHLLRGRFNEISAAEVMALLANTPLLVRQSWRYVLQHRAYNPADARVQLRVHCEQEPASASSITLSDERDSLGLLRTRLDWRISEVELRTMRIYAEIARHSLRGLAEVDIKPELLEGSGFEQFCDDSNHHMGGMRMADAPTTGVVDTDLKLHGLQNCFVCSGAVFPTSGFSNPTHTVLALAVRLARHLIRC